MKIPDRTNRMALKFVFCTLSLLFLLPMVRAADGFIKDVSSGCAVFKPNLKPGDAVRFKGSCANGFAHGSGVAIWGASDGTSLTFEGNFIQGKLQGNGTMTASGGDRYQGEYKEGKREGVGVYTSANGDRFNGQYKDNRPNGHGILTLANGSMTEGEWRNGAVASITSVTPPSAGLAGPKLGPPQSQVPTVPNSQGRASAAPDTETKGDRLSALREFFMGSRNGEPSVGDKNPLASNQGKEGMTPENSLSNKRTILGAWYQVVDIQAGRSDDNVDHVEFFKDKTLLYREQGSDYPGTWTDLDDGRIKMQITVFGMPMIMIGRMEEDVMVVEFKKTKILFVKGLKEAKVYASKHKDDNAITDPQLREMLQNSLDDSTSSSFKLTTYKLIRSGPSNSMMCNPFRAVVEFSSQGVGRMEGYERNYRKQLCFRIDKGHLVITGLDVSFKEDEHQYCYQRRKGEETWHHCG